MNVHFLIVGFVFFTATCFGQVAKEDFAKINQAYSNHTSVSMNVKYEVYRNRGDKEPFQTQHGAFKRTGNLYYSKIGAIQTVDTETYKMILDDDDQNITLLGKDNAMPENINSADIYSMNMDKLAQMCEKVEFKAENESQNSYVLSFENDEYEEIKIIYNKQTFFLEKMVLYYKNEQNLEDEKNGIKQAPRLEITYSQIELDVPFSKSEFTYDKFLIKKEGKFVGKDMYKNYTINNQLF